MPRLRLPPRALDVRTEADSGCARMVLPPARVPSVGVRVSSPPVALPPPRATPSVVGALVTPRRSPPPGSRTAAWLRRQDSATPAGTVAVCQRQCSHRHSHPHWRVGCCCVLARAPVALVRGRAANRQPDGAHAGHRSPHGAPPARGCLVQAAGREARHPCPALGEEGPAPHRTGASPLQVDRAGPATRRRRHGGAESTPVRSCSMRRPRRCCIPTWGHAVAWSVPSESP
jgi:hypothetical protein